MNINDNCSRCGKCCEAIWLAHSKEEVAQVKDNPDVDFILENWEPITKEEAEEVNPYFFQKNERFLQESYFYKCIAYDKENNLCGNHENRPNVCRNFPFYGNGNDMEINGSRKLHPKFSLYSSNCSFHELKATQEEWNSE